jgi:hypothetical protein
MVDYARHIAYDSAHYQSLNTNVVDLREDERRRRSEQIAREHLLAAAFDKDTLDPRVAWRPFKERRP